MNSRLRNYLRKLKIFVVLFTTGSTLAFLLRDHLVSWPSILVTIGSMSALVALLDDHLTQWGKTFLSKRLKQHSKDESSS